jgi:hypothetical protein
MATTMPSSAPTCQAGAGVPAGPSALVGRPAADDGAERDGYLLTLLRYIAMNPVRAGLVDYPEAWRWSSYPAFKGTDDVPPFLKVPSVLSTFGDQDIEVLRERFVR